MTVHIGSVNLYTAITTDDNILNSMAIAKMTIHIVFVNLFTAVLIFDVLGIKN